ncbi:type 2 lanthipeptide synthetase LanM family protein [Oceanobacillus kimchii]|uniref:type 2 lanthipeptide synthetase LanM family protein n=1 Tax=Oceanobacillus kimchii TaxID=746691 RepID=UPI003B014EAA
MSITINDFEKAFYSFEDKQSQPEWLDVLKDITKLKYHGEYNIKIPNQDSFICTNFYKPFIKYAVIQIDKYIEEQIYIERFINTHKFKANFIDELMIGLSILGNKTLITELHVAVEEGLIKGENSRERFFYFNKFYIDDYNIFLSILELYPVLARVLTEKVITLVKDTLQVISRYMEDYEEINEKFNLKRAQLLYIEGGQGDSHNKGQSVKTFTFETSKLVYKPKSLEIDYQFERFINWLNSQEIKCELKTATTVSKGEYGWQEFVTYEECTEKSQIQNFYYRQGVLLAVLYIFKGVDFHSENIMASGEYPILIDTETLFSNIEVFKENLDLDPISLEVQDSVLLSSMLPSFSDWDQIYDFDLSALGARGGQPSNKMISYDIKNRAQENMKLVKRNAVTTEKQNNPKLNGKFCYSENYINFILDGFEDTYKVFLSKKQDLLRQGGVLNWFKGVVIRHIIRPTGVYSRFLDASSHPKYLNDSKQRERLFEFLSTAGETMEGANVYIPSEISDLLQNDVPFFYFKADDTKLIDSNYKLINGAFKISALERSKNVIMRISLIDLNKQLRYIKLSLNTLNSIEKNQAINLGYNSNQNVNDLKSGIMNIADSIINRAILHNERPFWITNKLSESSITFSTLQLELYDGLTGLSIFYAEAGRVLNNKKYTDISQKILSLIQDSEQTYMVNATSISAFNGVGIFVYLYTYLGKLWGNKELLKRAEAVTIDICNRFIQSKNPLKSDFISGLAGLLKVVINLYDNYPTNEVKICLKHIYQRLKTNCILLLKNKLESDEIYTGFAHGYSGIAYALSTYVKYSDEKSETIDIVLQLVRKEDEYFVPSANNWKDIRKNNKELSPTFWCYGPPGILIGRTKLQIELPYLSNQDLMIEEALQGTLQVSEYNNHSICHGLFGNLLILKEFHSLRENHIVAHKIEELRKGMESSFINASYDEAELLGLFLGEAGFGYGMLKLYDNRVPSILTLDL